MSIRRFEVFAVPVLPPLPGSFSNASPYPNSIPNPGFQEPIAKQNFIEGAPLING